MDLATSKIELTKLILEIEDQDIISKIFSLEQHEQSDFWSHLSENQRKSIQLGINQLDNGEGIPLQDFIKQIS